MDRPVTPTLPTEKELLNSVEAGEILGVSKDTIVDWFNAGELPGAYKLNPRRKNSPLRVPRSAVEAKLRERDHYHGQDRRTGLERRTV